DIRPALFNIRVPADLNSHPQNPYCPTKNMGKTIGIVAVKRPDNAKQAAYNTEHHNKTAKKQPSQQG
ncbi:hypothetical protein, partial [Idiomarina sp. UBA1919]|uniref:hypothetical protein n=1 Tax=Idiomarina sp. UBA1919 TaxID=1946640 RepID=UPI00257C2CDA